MILGFGAVMGGLVLLLWAGRAEPVPHLSVDPGLFPTGIGVAAVVVGGILMAVPGRTDAPVVPGPSRAGLIGAGLTVGLPLLLALTLDRIGFALGLPMVLAPLMIRHGVHPGRATLLAVGLTAALVAVFTGLLRVPLPLGPLAGGLPWR
ncbi:tripartite tricarboxylate transporter TctB family protein [Rhodospira trueperi]|uniref:Tripartite tricarboxylate transporter TctB family protein n=1 Tax=Rhodospira trueperi TaxID=69960 RepID=A0A1G7ASN0_9PROT|nr:tripartite tricarboxylate transporter TctB family protein [Rhodospira trueperi]SDE17904.1 Tripartite tricarboxylate transporter TctB family protein [Rhodospira trueperi]